MLTLVLGGISNAGVALISGGAAVLGALVGGLISGGTTLFAEHRRQQHAEGVNSQVRYAKARVGARLVVSEMMDHVTSIEVEQDKSAAHKAWAFPTEEWGIHRAALFDVIEHVGWLNLSVAYMTAGLCEAALAEAAEEASPRAEDGSSEEEAGDGKDGEGESREDKEKQLQRVLSSAKEALDRANAILLPITEIGLPGRPSPAELMSRSAEEAVEDQAPPLAASGEEEGKGAAAPG